jgi:hypothetical protein
VPIEGKELRIGDRVPVTAFIPESNNKVLSVKIGEREVNLDENFGYFCGNYLASGVSNKYGIRISGITEDLCETNGWSIEMKENYAQVRNTYLTEFMTKTFGKSAESKTISSMIYQTDKNFLRGVLSGFIDNEGNIDTKKMNIRLTSINRQFLVEIAFIFNYFGIFCTINTEARRHNVIYVLNISRKYAINIERELNLKCLDKVNANN